MRSRDMRSGSMSARTRIPSMAAVSRSTTSSGVLRGLKWPEAMPSRMLFGERFTEPVVDPRVLGAEGGVSITQRPELDPDPPLHLVPPFHLERGHAEQGQKAANRVRLGRRRLLPVGDPPVGAEFERRRHQSVARLEVVLDQPD